MTPALTKVFKDGCGIHACACSLRMDPEGTARSCPELKTQLTSVVDADLQKLLHLLFSLPTSVVFSLSQDQVVLLPCASLLPGLLSVGEAAAWSQRDASVFPGGSDMFKRHCQEARLLYGRGPSPTHGPGGDDVPSAPLLDVAPSGRSQAETKPQDPPPVVVPSYAGVQEEAGPTGCLSPLSQQPYGDRSASSVTLTEALRPRLSRQAGLQSKAQRLQERLQVLLGEHAAQHCHQQMNALRRQLHAPALSRDFARSCGEDRSFCAELGEFVRSQQAVLRRLQAALDSEATLSSSSDEEHEEVRGSSTREDLSGSSSERWWLEERAELGSRWSWLQVRLADLEQRTRHMEELHKHIRSTKGKVVLAESQPLTDMQIQQTLLREMAGLSCTAVDADSEPCSPTRLLYNIERQSAQLSRFVNSLMPPLGFFPGRQRQSCKRQKVFPSGRTYGPFPPRSSSRRRLLSNRTRRAEMSCVCARTRPLVSFHKPRLFALSASGPACPQDSGRSASPLFSSHRSSPPLRRSCSGAVVPRHAPDSSSSSSGTSRTSIPTAQAASSDTTVANLGREEWSLRCPTADIQPYSPAEHTQRSSTPVHSIHKLYTQHRRRPSRRFLHLSPIEGPNRRANQRKQKRRHIHRPIEDEDILRQLSDTEDSSDGFPEQRFTKVPSRQTPPGFVGKRQEESIYNINNIVIHTLAAKIEKLQYKNIITPSWRVTDPSSVIRKETEDEDGQEEDLANNVFARRHQASEHREKLARASWGTRKGRKYQKRCVSRPEGHGGGTLTSGEESSAEWRGAQLDTDEEQPSEKCLLWSPWKRRMFPLNEDEEKALVVDDEADQTPERGPVSGSAAARPENSNSQLSPASVTGALLPPGGQNTNS